jgi:gamma-glutamylcyclotransferase
MISAMSQLYFAYGSNMSSRRLGTRIRPAAQYGAARLPDWRLVFNKPGRDGSGKANLIEQPGAESWGVVWEVSEDDWPTLDAFEPGYRRDPCRVFDLTGAVLHAHVYLYLEPGPDLTPWLWYLEHLLEGAREHDLPVSLVAEIARTKTRA